MGLNSLLNNVAWKINEVICTSTEKFLQSHKYSHTARLSCSGNVSMNHLVSCFWRRSLGIMVLLYTTDVRDDSIQLAWGAVAAARYMSQPWSYLFAGPWSHWVRNPLPHSWFHADLEHEDWINATRRCRQVPFSMTWTGSTTVACIKGRVYMQPRLWGCPVHSGYKTEDTHPFKQFINGASTLFCFLFFFQ